MMLGRLKATGGNRQVIDREEAARALRLLVDPEQGCELRGITSRVGERPLVGSRVRRGSDVGGLLAATDDLADLRAIYHTLNPVPPRAKPVGTMNDEDVICRHNLLLDIDPVRAESKTTDATDEEKAQAIALGEHVRDDLTERDGWPAPTMFGDSGNGCYLVYRIALPNDPLSMAICKSLLIRLAERFDRPGATIDTSCYNASRIMKLMGTWSQKGPNTEERPHRQARIIEATEDAEVVSIDLLKATARLCGPRSVEEQLKDAEAEQRARKRAAKEAAKQAPIIPNGIPAHDAETVVDVPASAFRKPLRATSHSEIDVEARAIAWLAEAEAAVSGQKGHSKALWAARGLVVGFLLSRDRALALLMEHYNPRCQPPWTEAELLHKVEEAATTTAEKAPGWLLNEPLKNGTYKTKKEEPKVKPDETLTIPASDIKPEKISWLWPGILPRGKLVTWAGQTSMGKSFLACDIAARLSIGGEIPFGAGELFQQAGSLIINSEDGYADTLVPRLIEAKADLTRVRFLKTEKLAVWTMAHLDTLEKAISETKDCQFVVIDPATAHLGGIDDHKNAELRQLIMPLTLRVQEWGVVLVFITHFNKAGAAKVEVLARVMGSVAWVASVRCASAFIPGPTHDNRERCLFVPLKSNIAKKPKTMAYQIDIKNEERAQVKWLEQIDVSADEAMDASKSMRPRARNAAEWLASIFKDRPEVPSAEIFAAAKGAGVSDSALREAKASLRITARQVFGEGGGNYWLWAWPKGNEVPKTDGQTAAAGDSDPFADVPP